MKTQFIVQAVLLLFSFNALAAGDGVGNSGTSMVFNFRNLVTMSNDLKIESISDARLQAVVSSGGSVLRPDCFKEYKSNLPFSPQTVSYTISQNIPLKVKGKYVYIAKLFEVSESNRSTLKKNLNFGCDIYKSATLIINGRLEDGENFSTTLELILEDTEGIVQVGSVQVPIAAGQAQTLDVLPTVFDLRTLRDLWQDFDPNQSRPVKNY